MRNANNNMVDNVMHKPSLIGAALASLTLAACVPPVPQASPSPTPSPAAAPAPIVAPPQLTAPRIENWMDAPLTPGDWFYVAENDETIASFGTSSAPSATRLVVVCRKAQRRVAIGYVGQASGQASGQVEMRIRTESAERTLTAGPAEGRAPLILTELPVFDTLLDAMAFSKGRIAIDVAGQQGLILPAYPEITRVIEDCRG